MMKIRNLIILLVLGLFFGCQNDANKNKETNKNTETTDYSVEENLIYSRTFEAVLWSLPAVSNLQMRAALKQAGVQKNGVAYFGSQPQSDLRLPTFNNTVPYLFGSLDLSEGPLVIEIPAANEKAKIFGSMMNVWDRSLEDFGPAGIDKGKGGKFLFLPPGYEDKTPAGYHEIQSNTFEIHPWFRFVAAASGEQGWQDALDFLRNVKIYPVSEAKNPSPTAFFDATAYEGIIQGTPLAGPEFIEHLNALVQEEPIQEMDKMAYGMLSAIGIKKGETFEPTQEDKKLILKAVEDAFVYMENYLASGKPFSPFWEEAKWGPIALTPEVIKSNASWNFEDQLDYTTRALDFYYWAAGIPKYFSEGGATFYVLTAQDSDGDKINGANNYKLTVPANVPAEDFWSVILYSTHHRSFMLTEQFGVSSKDKLEINADGTVDIYIGPKAPEGKESNWVQTDPNDGVFACMRFYGPTKELFSREWVINDVEKLK